MFLIKLLMKITITINEKILDTSFNYVLICIKNENKENIMKDFF